jgi:hypothetical protein
VEAKIAGVHAEHIPALESSWKRLHTFLTDVAAECKAIEAHETAIENSNAIARKNDRVDLVKRVRGVRDGVAAAHAVSLPEPLRAVPVRGKKESADGFALRVRNLEAQRNDVLRRHEPFATAGTAAVEAIVRIAVDDPDIRVALRAKMRRHDRVNPLVPPPGEASNDPAERAALEREFKRQNARHDPANYAAQERPEPHGGASTYNRYEFGGL